MFKEIRESIEGKTMGQDTTTKDQGDENNSGY